MAQKTVALPGVLPMLQDSLEIYKDNFLTVAGYVTWLLIPYLGLMLLKFLPPEHWGTIAGMIILNLAQIALWLWVIVMLVSLARSWIVKRPLDEEKAMINSWRLVLPLAAVAILQALILIGGLLVFIVPGLIFFVWYAFAQMAVILDKKRGFEALTQSRELSRGRFWLVAWKIVGGPIIFLVAFSVLLSLLTAVFASLGGVDMATLGTAVETGEIPVWIEVIDALSQTFVVTPILLIYGTLLFEKLKKSKVVKSK